MKHTPCKIIEAGKRRDGGTRFWCTAHRADATAKYGVKAKTCRYAFTRFGYASPTTRVSVDDFPGGVAAWGAVPPVYDTTRLPLDAGIHIHARTGDAREKDVDKTFANVELVLGATSWRIEELDAINQMVSSVLGIHTSAVACTNCGRLHLDKDWFSLHAHARHLCAWCGQHFKDRQKAVGNPVAALPPAFTSLPAIKSKRKIKFSQRNFAGGIRIWGSNPAIAWTGTHREEAGIHLHAYGEGGDIIEDDTFGDVVIDGIRLDPHWTRVLMAQNSLPHLAGRIVSLICPHCGNKQKDYGIDAFTPRRERTCETCEREFAAPGRLKKVIANPLVSDLEVLARFAVRSPAKHDLGLLPESL